jgi:hypothetical protein
VFFYVSSVAVHTISFHQFLIWFCMYTRAERLQQYSNKKFHFNFFCTRHRDVDVIKQECRHPHVTVLHGTELDPKFSTWGIYGFPHFYLWDLTDFALFGPHSSKRAAGLTAAVTLLVTTRHLYTCIWRTSNSVILQSFLKKCVKINDVLCIYLRLLFSIS